MAGRRLKSSVFRSYVKELERIGALAEVRAGASPTLAALLDEPRAVSGWMDPAPFEEITALLLKLRGREAVRTLGYQVMKTGFTAVFEPVFHVALALAGGAGSLFSRAEMLASIVSDGVEMRWAPSGPNGGTMRLRCAEPLPPASWIPWEGCYVYGLEVAKTEGKVSEARPSADGRTCEIDVSWKER